MSVVQWTTGIQHIGIPTSDIETTIRFYEGLGFQTMHTNQVPANQAKVAFLSWKPDDRDLCRRRQRYGRASITSLETAQIFRLLMHGSVSRDIKCCRMELKNFHSGKRVWLSLLSKDRIKNGSSSVNGNSNGTLPL